MDEDIDYKRTYSRRYWISSHFPSVKIEIGFRIQLEGPQLYDAQIGFPHSFSNYLLEKVWHAEIYKGIHDAIGKVGFDTRASALDIQCLLVKTSEKWDSFSNRELSRIANKMRNLAEQIITELLNQVMEQYPVIELERIGLQLVPVDLLDIVESALDMRVKIEPQIQYINEVLPDIPLVNADETRLLLVLNWLLSDISFFIDTGSIVVRAELGSSDDDQTLEIIIQGITTKTTASNSIDNTGPNHELGNESIESTNGFAKIQRLIEMQNGRLEPDPDDVATFHIWLPVA